jgi:predicted AAA+ superfamily ATPase
MLRRTGMQELPSLAQTQWCRFSAGGAPYGNDRFAGLASHWSAKEQIERNTRQFVHGAPANNVLLTGARGTGKSSLIKACLTEFAAQGLRLIEVDKADLADLPDIVELVATRHERFIIFCDDLSFEEGEAGYKALKVAPMAVSLPPVTQRRRYVERRHLLPENGQITRYRHTEDGDLHPGETVEEKISLSERFGLWISFYPFAG